jgi:hypothetical protein
MFLNEKHFESVVEVIKLAQSRLDLALKDYANGNNSAALHGVCSTLDFLALASKRNSHLWEKLQSDKRIRAQPQAILFNLEDLLEAGYIYAYSALERVEDELKHQGVVLATREDLEKLEGMRKFAKRQGEIIYLDKRIAYLKNHLVCRPPSPTSSSKRETRTSGGNNHTFPSKKLAAAAAHLDLGLDSRVSCESDNPTSLRARYRENSPTRVQSQVANQPKTSEGKLSDTVFLADLSNLKPQRLTCSLTGKNASVSHKASTTMAHNTRPVPAFHPFSHPQTRWKLGDEMEVIPNTMGHFPVAMPNLDDMEVVTRLPISPAAVAVMKAQPKTHQAAAILMHVLKVTELCGVYPGQTAADRLWIEDRIMYHFAFIPNCDPEVLEREKARFRYDLATNLEPHARATIYEWLHSLNIWIPIANRMSDALGLSEFDTLALWRWITTLRGQIHANKHFYFRSQQIPVRNPNDSYAAI